jgi:Na+/H+-dicarboxylate symporter
MELPTKPQKKSRLTLYIIIGLIIGIATGFALNKNYVNEENTKLEAFDVQLNEIKIAQRTATDSALVATLLLEKQRVNTQRNEVLSARDKKTEPFSVLADVFLRLIKMIVAPLVFTTLVVGVAKLGDINAVGRIGGKTLLWFVGASLMSLLLGMILVNIFEPGIAMHLPVPDTGESSGIANVGFSLKNFLYHIFPRLLQPLANVEKL